MHYDFDVWSPPADAVVGSDASPELLETQAAIATTAIAIKTTNPATRNISTPFSNKYSTKSITNTHVTTQQTKLFRPRVPHRATKQADL